MKGTMADLFFVAIFLFLIGITLLVSYFLLDEIQSGTNGTLDSNYFTKGKTALEGFNFGILMILFGVVATIIMSAFMIRTHPAFAVFSILMLVIVIVVGIQFSNFYNTFASTTSFSSIASTEFSIVTWLMNNLPIVLLIFGILIIIIMYGRSYFKTELGI